MNDIQLATDAVALQKTSPLNGLIDISIPRMIESGYLDSCLETQLSSLADSTMFMDSVITRIMNQRYFRASVARFFKNTVHDKVQVAAVQAPIQEAVRAALDVQKLEPVKIPSPPKRSSLPSASKSDGNEKSRHKKRPRRSSRKKLRKSPFSSLQNETSSN